jgi:hypothetical protein
MKLTMTDTVVKGHGTMDSVPAEPQDSSNHRASIEPRSRGVSPMFEDKQVRAGDGTQRNQVIQGAGSVGGFWSKASHVFGRLANALTGIFSSTAREARVEAAFRLSNADMISALGVPRDGNSLAMDGAVLSRLQDHAQKNGSPLGREEIRELVAVGERLSSALKTTDVETLKREGALKVPSENGDFTVKSGIYTSRALSWYMMAMAAQRDETRPDGVEGSVASSGGFILKDPDHKLYTFLSQAPTSSTRMSTHVTERSATQDRYKLFGLFSLSGKPAQMGIEDYSSRFPGKGGCILFDRLTNGETYVKFESVGCPSLFGATEPHETDVKAGRFISAVGRNIGHMFNFLQTRSGPSESATESVRQEHAHKGMLKKPVYEPFIELAKRARALGADVPLLAKSQSAMKEQAKHTGLPFIMSFVVDVKAWAEQPHDDKTDRSELGRMAEELEMNIQIACSRLGWQSDHLGIERRGAEVHLALA